MRILAWVLGGLGVLLILLVLLWFGYGLYMQWVVARSPSTAPVIKTAEGDVRLGQYVGGHQLVPEDPLPPTGVVASPAGSGAADPAPATVPTVQAGQPVLPPTRLAIAKIGVDSPVVLADNDHLPQFKAVGWYMGTGFPGFRGNMVIFGHVNGDYETFGRLDELKAGDEVVVQAMEATFRYRVTDLKVVPKDDVSVMLPTRDSRATLITCTGDFLPLTRDYTHRLIVTASLVK